MRIGCCQVRGDGQGTMTDALLTVPKDKAFSAVLLFPNYYSEQHNLAIPVHHSEKTKRESTDIFLVHLNPRKDTS